MSFKGTGLVADLWSDPEVEITQDLVAEIADYCAKRGLFGGFEITYYVPNWAESEADEDSIPRQDRTRCVICNQTLTERLKK